jgi:hypothetical protein
MGVRPRRLKSSRHVGSNNIRACITICSRGEAWAVRAFDGKVPNSSITAGAGKPRNGIGAPATPPRRTDNRSDPARHIHPILNSRVSEIPIHYGCSLTGPADVHVRHQWPPNWQPPQRGIGL